MKTLYIDCGMGAAGDMLTAALLELMPDADAFLAKLNRIGLPDVVTERQTVAKCGINGTHVSVRIAGEEEAAEDAAGETAEGTEEAAAENADMNGHCHEHPHNHEHKHEHEHGHHHKHDHAECSVHEHEHCHDHSHHHDHADAHEHSHPHTHRSMDDIEALIAGLNISDKAKADVRAVYSLIAEAESAAHGVPVSEIHFHEVGTMDALADITAVCLLMEALAPQQVVVSPIHVGCGQVRCAHGILPVPAPATAYILQGIPIYGGRIRGELCTPTGAALLKHFATAFGDMPVMATEKIGYGMGKKDFEAANCVRAMLGETADKTDEILQLNCNVDDMTGEEIGFATERLFEAGAREVFTVPIGMKKSRPGILLCVLCDTAQKDAMLDVIFRHTTTIGVREMACRRTVMERKIQTKQTPYGEVRCKQSVGCGVSRSKYEYEDLARIAKERGISLEAVRKLLDED